jgi:hypothetical protein
MESDQLHAPGRFILKDGAPGSQWIEDCVGHRFRLAAVQKRNILAPDRNLTPAMQLAAIPTELFRLPRQ